VEFLQLSSSLRCPLVKSPRFTHCFNWLTPRLADISHQPPNLRSTDSLTTGCRSESELLYDWCFGADDFVLAASPFRITTNNFIFQLNTCGCSPYVTFSMTRGCVCPLQLLLGLASAVILRSESRGTHDSILLSQIRDSPHPPRIGSHGNNTRHWVPFSSPPTTRRATMKVFDPASTRGKFRLQLGWCPRYVTPWRGSRRKRRFKQFLYRWTWTRCRGNLFVLRSLPSNGSTRYNVYEHPS
jgi:hypothetical protein